MLGSSETEISLRWISEVQADLCLKQRLSLLEPSAMTCLYLDQLKRRLVYAWVH